MTDCFHCGEPEVQQRCGHCHIAAYCGRDCQAQDWVQGGHSRMCFVRDTVDGERLADLIDQCISNIHACEDPTELDEDDRDHVEYGELLADALTSTPSPAGLGVEEIRQMALEWLDSELQVQNLGDKSLFATDKAKEAHGLKKQARGVRQERRAQGVLNPKRLVLRAKEGRLRGRAATKKRELKKKDKWRKRKHRRNRKR